MTVGPQYYTTQSGWQTSEEDRWDAMIDKLDSFSTAGQALKFIFLVMAEFLIDYSDGQQAWTGYDMNATSGLETDVSNVMRDVNECENGSGSISTVNDAVNNMNDFLVQIYTNPALENEQLQAQAKNSGTDLLGGSDNFTVEHESVDVYYDGSDQPTQVTVPQITMTTEQENTVLNNWDGNSYIVTQDGQPTPSSIDPSNEGYQEYLSEQSQWMTDLTTVDDSCGEIDQVSQAEYSQDQSNQKMELGTLFQAFKNQTSAQSYWNQQGGKSQEKHMADSSSEVFKMPENAQLYVMEASCDKITADSVLNNAVIQLAITISNELEEISTAEMNTISEMIDGTYSGWMGTSPGFPNQEAGEDGSSSDDDSNDISITSTLINEAQSVFGAQTSTAQSSQSNLTGNVQMSQQRITAVENFMSKVVNTMDYVASLLQQSL